MDTQQEGQPEPIQTTTIDAESPSLDLPTESTGEQIVESTPLLSAPAPIKSSKNKFISAIIATSVLGIAIILVSVFIFETKNTQEVEAEEVNIFINPFDSISIEGQSAIVLDLQTGKTLYAKNASTTLPLASVTKLMTAFTALSHAPDILSIYITPEDIALEGDQGLLPGETWRLKDLLDFSLVTSSNDGMHSISRNVGYTDRKSEDPNVNREYFIDLMNKTAQELGLRTMSFTNETGLDNEDLNMTGGKGSAHDVAELIGLLLEKYPDAVTRTRSDEFSVTSLSGFVHVGKNTNLSAAAIPGLMASKTGFTDLAGGNLAIVFNRGLNYPMAVVVLGSTIEGRFRDVETLVNATHEYFKNNP